MATAIMTATHRFPVGTTLGIYAIPRDAPETWSPRRNGTRGRPRTDAPTEPIAETEMAMGGAMFTGLTEGRYLVAGDVEGEWRVVRVLAKVTD